MRRGSTAPSAIALNKVSFLQPLGFRSVGFSDQVGRYPAVKAPVELFALDAELYRPRCFQLASQGRSTTKLCRFWRGFLARAITGLICTVARIILTRTEVNLQR
jgi:hypothetical protein